MKVELATFGGGCFWCTEAIFQQLKGVLKVTNGYSGGEDPNPSYREVCGGRTGHAEVIQIEFDSQEISYEDILKIHLTTHDPTTLNAQGADHGTQYRSIILVHNPEQKAIAEQVISEIQSTFSDPIITQIVDFEKFYPAEGHHQDYYNQNTIQPYCQAVINPKLEKFRSLFKDKVK